ncbi:histamine H2 receptor-like [Hydractinia symbiolongicarpus]|uniref:histamine H2 receptor-like n=1 Tax=Hydractinia symbiolongicarpus TaxID=13093 RepID=UPI00254A9998|nr:histamine H2 receptor-like [Hydractinia symbiolongicarpus]
MAFADKPQELMMEDGDYYGIIQCPSVGLYYSETSSYQYNLLAVGLFNIFFSIPTFIFNFLILLTFIKQTNLRKLGNTILISLSLCDLLSGMIAQPVLVSLIAILLTKKPTEIPCDLVTSSSVLGYTLACISLLTVSFISLERYLAIFHPFLYERSVTKRWLYTGCASIWVVSIVMMPALLLVKILHVYFFWVNAILITFTYVWNTFIYVRITTRANELRREQRTLQSRFGAPKAPGCNQSKATKVAGSIILALLLCYLPQVAVSVWQLIKKSRFLYEYCEYWTMTFGLLNPGLNPIFYCYYNSQIRKELFLLLGFSPHNVSPANSNSTTPQILPHRMVNDTKKKRSATSITFAD